MKREIILLTGAVEAPHLEDALLDARDDLGPDFSVAHVYDRAGLETAVAQPKPEGVRIVVAYCTNVIVPASVLAACHGWAYNFHPAPPSYPGTHPANFAIRDGAKQFGVTAHVMTEQVDAGAIVDVNWFDVPEGTTATALEEMAYVALFGLFRALAPALASSETKIPEIDAQWSGPVNTKEDVARARTENPNF